MEKLSSGARKLGLNLSSRQLELFDVYFRELVDWNQRINLTSVTGYEDVQVRHFLDSLTVVLGLWPQDKEHRLYVVDIGTGAGLPGIPLKIALPEINLALIEATAKKTKFLRDIVAKLCLENVEVLTGRAEDLAHDERYREKFDLALSRAVAALPALVELSLPFCAIGGIFIAQKKGEIGPEVAQSSRAIEVVGGRLKEVKPVNLEGLADNRYLIIIDKVRPTPPAYPRRPGIPGKRPIVG